MAAPIITGLMALGGFALMLRIPDDADRAEAFAVWFGFASCAGVVGLLSWVF